MSVSRHKELIPSPYTDLQFYTDLSQFTLQKHRNLGTITKALRNHKLSYKWGFPTKLIVTKDRKEHIMDSVDKGMGLLSKWGIIPEPSTSSRYDKDSNQESEWRTVNQKNARSHK